MGAFRSLVATFVPVVFAWGLVASATADTLTVGKAGSGTGTVTSIDGNISCGADCSNSYAAGTAITLFATPSAGSQFTGWLGPCTGSAPCSFMIVGATSTVATFAPVAIGEPSLDIDATGALDALTDGLLVLRYLFGLSGPSLTTGAVPPGAGRTTEEIEGYLADTRPVLDVDGNGQLDALTDGLLTIRYLFGLRGETLVAGAIGTGALRNTSPEIEAALLAIFPKAGPPPDPATVAPSVDRSVPTTVFTTTEFLYTGDQRTQTGVAPGTIQPRRATVLRGKVQTRDGGTLSGATITVVAHPEFGQTLSRDDGAFDLAVNGGGLLTVNYAKPGFLPVQRQTRTPWQDYVTLPDVVMTPLDPEVTPISLNSGSMQRARGSPMADAAGPRRAMLLVPAGTTANLVMANGSTQPLGLMNVRATEYTVGANGPSAMPAILPPASGYTYAVELSADEAIATGAKSVEFNQPVFSYVENFLGFPVGGAVPAGYYDRARTAWVPSDNGRIIKITAIVGDTADVDTVGTGGLSPLPLSVAERQQLAQTYAVGQELWRVPVAHFTPWDYNWPYGPPNDAIAPDASAGNNDPLDNPTCSAGSIIECENQTLGESVRLVGTPYTLNYRSDRVPGRTAARRMDIRLSGASVPPSLSAIRLRVEITGRLHDLSFPAEPNLNTSVAWNGTDAYSRTVQGAQTAIGSVDYIYPAVYKSPADFAQSFGSFGGSQLIADTSRATVTISKPIVLTLGTMDARAAGLGGWTLNAHHFYDPVSRVLYTGDGRRRTAPAKVVETAAIAPGISKVAVAADGSVFFTMGDRVNKLDTDGTITTVAGGGGSSGDGIPATQALLAPQGVAISPDGSIYFGDNSSSSSRVRKVSVDGMITTVAGVLGPRGFSGDGGPATQAQMTSIHDIAIAPDGSIYIADYHNARTRRVATNGIIRTAAGNGFLPPFDQQGLPATSVSTGPPRSIAVGSDGTLYVGDSNAGNPIFRFGPDGIMWYASDPFDQVGGLAVGPDGLLYASASYFTWHIDLVRSDKSLLRIFGADNPGALTGDGGPSIKANGLPHGLAFAPNGTLYFADSAGGGALRRIGPALPGYVAAAFAIPSEDGGELYAFAADGRHLQTLNALTGATLREFGYDGAGRLVTITEKTGGTDNVTTIQRDASGNPTSIVGPYGQVTTVSVDGNGFLANVSNPAGETIALASTAGGLLTSYTDPRNKTTTFTYDPVGRLSLDADPAGGSQALARVDSTNAFTTTRTTALGRVTSYETQTLPGNVRQRRLTTADGSQAVTSENLDAATTTATAADGTVTTLVRNPDARFAMQSSTAGSLSIAVPGGLTLTATASQMATLTNPLDPLSLTSLAGTATVDGRSTTSTFSAASKTYTTTTPVGRISSLTIDSLGRTLSTQVNGFSTGVNYDNRGRIAAITRGTGPSARTLGFTYNQEGLVQSITDPIGRTAQMTYDSAGRMMAKSFPGGRTVSFAYDAAGNMTSLTPPGRPAHTFTYSARNELLVAAPPTIPGTGPIVYGYNLDRQPTTVLKPDGRSITISYDVAGRIATRGFLSNGLPTGTDTLSYDSAGRISSVTAASGVTTAFDYAGSLLTGRQWSGPTTGSVTQDYDTSFRLSSESVNGANTIGFSYDNDDLLIAAGELTIAHQAQSTLPSGSSLGVVTTSVGFDSFGELASYSAKVSGNTVFNNAFTRDQLGRVTQKSETVDGITDAYSYTYDVASRLTVVSKNGIAIENYGYDDNSNRTSATVAGSSVTASYDDHDRLNQYGAAAYTYDASGALLSKTTGAGTTSYQYDQLGNLLGLVLPNGTSIAYVIDGNNRRVGKKLNGAQIKGFLYNDGLRPVAELDGAGALVGRFVYAGSNVPVSMIRGGVTYRIITDQVGSVRLVIDSASGAVLQQLKYDTFGNVIVDTNPGFQPFGFAGGIYDSDSKLVRFGTRDYDSEIGRWTAKDRIQFAGGDSNLYSYAGQDPMNRRDPRGLDFDWGVWGAFALQTLADMGNRMAEIEGGPDMGSGDRTANGGCVLIDSIKPGSCPSDSSNRRPPRPRPAPAPRSAPDGYEGMSEDPLLSGMSEEMISEGQPEISPTITPPQQVRRRGPRRQPRPEIRCDTTQGQRGYVPP